MSNVANYTEQGGARSVIGGSLDVVSGGELDLESGSTLKDGGTAGLGAARLQDAILNGAKIANVATANVIGGIEVIHMLTVADGATADIDITLTHKTRITDVWLVKTGAAGHASEDTITVKNAADAITDAIAVGAADKAIKRASTIDDAYWEIAAAGTLRITRTKGAGGGNNVACTVFVRGLRVA